MLTRFTQFGTNMVYDAVNFVRPPILNSARPLSLDDARALKGAVCAATLPMVQGTASVEGGGRERQTVVSGTGDELPQALSFRVALGEFLPADNLSAPRAFAVLGSKVRSELFGVQNPLGQRIRVGGQRYTVVGVMESKGTMFGFDLDDAVYIPVARGLELFNREGLFEIDVLYEEGAPVEEVVKAVSRVLIARHGGEDFTITTQQQMLEVLGSVLNVVTFAVGALGGISLLMGVASSRSRPLQSASGLQRSACCRRQQRQQIRDGSSVVLLLAALAGCREYSDCCITLLVVTVPALPVSPAWGYMGLAVVVSLSSASLPVYCPRLAHPTRSRRVPACRLRAHGSWKTGADIPAWQPVAVDGRTNSVGGETVWWASNDVDLRASPEAAICLLAPWCARRTVPEVARFQPGSRISDNVRTATALMGSWWA